MDNYKEEFEKTPYIFENVQEWVKEDGLNIRTIILTTRCTNIGMITEVKECLTGHDSITYYILNYFKQIYDIKD